MPHILFSYAFTNPDTMVVMSINTSFTYITMPSFSFNRNSALLAKTIKSSDLTKNIKWLNKTFIFLFIWLIRRNIICFYLLKIIIFFICWYNYPLWRVLYIFIIGLNSQTRIRETQWDESINDIYAKKCSNSFMIYSCKYIRDHYIWQKDCQD